MVGRSGNAGERVGLLTARPRTLPDLTCGVIEFELSIINCTWPAMRSMVPAAPPLYGTCTMRVPVMNLNNSKPTWPGVPLPDDALESLSGYCFA